MILQQGNRMVGREDPVIEWRLRTRGPSRPRLRCLSRQWLCGDGRLAHPAERSSAGLDIEQRRRRPIQQFFRPELLQFLLSPPQSTLSRKFRGAKLTCGKIQRREPHALSYLRQRRQKIV